MSGKVLIVGLLALAAIAGGALYYFQNYAYYQSVEPIEFEMNLTPVGGGAPTKIAARDFQIIDAGTSPLKFRACFRVINSIAMMTESYEVYEGGTPLQSPGWFDCFDHAQLSEDLDSGLAFAFLSERNISTGVDRVVAVYDDGRAYAWHQLNDTFGN